MFVVAVVSGMVGRVVAEAVLEQGHQVRVLVRDRSKGEAWLRRGAQVASLDDGAELAHALDRADGFYVRLPEFTRASPVHAHRRDMVDTIAAAVMVARVPHVLVLSTALADGSGERLATDLHHAEKALRGTGSVVTTIRSSYSQENAPATARIIGSLATRRLLRPPARSDVIDLVGPMYSLHRFSAKLGASRGKELRVLPMSSAQSGPIARAEDGTPGSCK